MKLWVLTTGATARRTGAGRRADQLGSPAAALCGSPSQDLGSQVQPARRNSWLRSADRAPPPATGPKARHQQVGHARGCQRSEGPCVPPGLLWPHPLTMSCRHARASHVLSHPVASPASQPFREVPVIAPTSPSAEEVHPPGTVRPRSAYDASNNLRWTCETRHQSERGSTRPPHFSRSWGPHQQHSRSPLTSSEHIRDPLPRIGAVSAR